MFGTLDESLSSGISQAMAMQSDMYGMSEAIQKAVAPLANYTDQARGVLTPLAEAADIIAKAAAPLTGIDYAIIKASMPPAGFSNIIKSSYDIAAMANGIKASDAARAAISPLASLSGAAVLKAFAMPALPRGLYSENIAKAMMGPPAMIQSAIQALTLSNAWATSQHSLAAVRFEPPPLKMRLRPASSNRPPQRPEPSQSEAADYELLPPEVVQSQQLFARFIKLLKSLPPADIILALDYQLGRHADQPRTFVDRLTHYLAGGVDFEPQCWQMVRYWLDSTRQRVGYSLWGSPTATDAAPILLPAGSPPTKPLHDPFAALLLNCTVLELRTLLTSLGLLTPAGQAAPSASPGAWVGVIHGLLDATPSRLRNNKAAIRRAFCEQFGAKVGERAVQVGPVKRGSEAERFWENTLALLREPLSAD